MAALSSFRSKIFTKPCKCLLHFFTNKKYSHIRIGSSPLRFRHYPAFRFRHLVIKRRKKRESTTLKKRINIRARFCNFSCMNSKKMGELGELRSFVESVRDREPLPSPLTPAYVKLAAAQRLSAVDEESYNEDDGDIDDVEEACRSFENYLAEMVIEEGLVRDLNDVEELLYCWESLKSPVFIDLVSRFYGELCTDLFSGY